MISARNTLVAMLLLAVAVPGLAREWQSADGKYSLQAEYVTSNKTHVQLQKPNGSKVAVPLSQLSEADRAFVVEKAPDEPAPAGGTGDVEAANKMLEILGVRILPTGLSLAKEGDLSSKLREAARVRKQVLTAQRLVDNAAEKQDLAKQAINQIVQRNMQLNAQLARVAPNNVSLNNKLVGAINANESQAMLMAQGVEKIEA